MTAMQELKSDLLLAIQKCHEALEEIKDLRTRETCQAIVQITIDNILNRIDTELLEMEKQQIIESYRTGRIDQHNNEQSNYNRMSEQYYNETFKSE